jgi:hypothetical protein
VRVWVCALENSVEQRKRKVILYENDLNSGQQDENMMYQLI